MIRDRVLKRDLTNIRLINHDAFLVLRDMIPDASIAELHIYFPDPWPRKREQKRRIIRPEVLEEMRRVLVDGGSAIYVTDHRDYFEVAAPLIEAVLPRRAPHPRPRRPAAHELRGEVPGGGPADLRGPFLEVSVDGGLTRPLIRASRTFPASGAKGDKDAARVRCPSPRVNGERVAEGRVRGSKVPRVPLPRRGARRRAMVRPPHARAA